MRPDASRRSGTLSVNPNVGSDAACYRVGDRAAAHRCGAGRPAGDCRRYLVADDVDDASQRTAPVQQRRRPSDDLHPTRRRPVQRRGVVGPGRRHVPDPHAVLQHENAVAAQAADHRAGRGRSHRRYSQPGLPRKRARHGTLQATLKLFAGHDVHRTQRLLGRARRDGTGHHHPGERDRRGHELHHDRTGDPVLGQIHCSTAVAQALDADRRGWAGDDRLQAKGAAAVRERGVPSSCQRHDDPGQRSAGLGVADDSVDRLLGGHMHGTCRGRGPQRTTPSTASKESRREARWSHLRLLQLRPGTRHLTGGASALGS